MPRPVVPLLGVIVAAALAMLVLSCATLPPAGPDQEVLAQHKLAADYARQGDSNLVIRNWQLAETFYRKSLETNEAVDNQEGVVQSYFSLGFLYLNRGMPTEADAQFHLATELAAGLGSAWYRVQSLINLAKVQLWRKNPAEALDLLDQALAEAMGKAGGKTQKPETAGPGVEIPKEPDERQRNLQKATFLHSRGVAYKDLKRETEARADLEAALAINVSLGSIKERAANLYVLASLDNGSGAYDKALAGLTQALALDKQAESSEGIAADLYAMSQVFRKLAGTDGKPRLAEALDCLRRSFQASLAIDDPVAVERCLPQLVELTAKLGKTADQAVYAAMLAKLQANKDKK